MSITTFRFNPYYNYYPSLADAAAFAVLFGVLTLSLLVLNIKWGRHPWVWLGFVGGVGEIIGWAGQIWSSANIYSVKAYLMQEVCLCIAPLFYLMTFTATYAAIVPLVSHKESILARGALTVYNVAGNLIILALLAVGTGLIGYQMTTGRPTSPGSNTALAGFVIQLIATIFFGVMTAVYYRRTRFHSGMGSNGTPARHRRHIMSAMFAGTFALFARAIYRVVYFSEGVYSKPATSNVCLIIFEGAAMVLCQLALIIAHPAVWAEAFATGSGIQPPPEQEQVHDVNLRETQPAEAEKQVESRSDAESA